MSRYYQDVVAELQAASEKMDRLWEEQKAPLFHDHAVVCADAALCILNYQQQMKENTRPLTPDDLAGMWGEPIWIDKNGSGHWDIVDDVGSCLVTREGERFELSGMGKTWNAYRSKPQERSQQEQDAGGMIVERLFAWDYERAEDRADEVKSQLADNNTLCVLTDHDWAHDAHSLEVYVPVHRQKDFRGGYYKERAIKHYPGLSEGEAYMFVGKLLQDGHTVRFTYDGKRRTLIVIFLENDDIDTEGASE